MIYNYIYISLIGLVMIFITTLIIYELFGKVWTYLPRFSMPKHVKVLLVIFPIFTAHILNIWLYGLVYFIIGNFWHMGSIIGWQGEIGLNLSGFTGFI